MLNGKFYTGLTPKQMNRCSDGQNRQESHFFWPDDTQKESPVETRLKRRASLQLEQWEKPRIQRQASVDECDANTKARFHKEFAKSSIQFYDNIAEQPENERPQSSRAQAILRARSARREIAPKPTATRWELPDKVIDEEYTTAKKDQTYNSKIKFYDIVDEELNNANKNNSRNLIDMNDKRELERNAKNSPKLQIKRNVSDFSDVEDVPEVKFRNDFMRTDVVRNNRRIRAEPVKNNAFHDEDNSSSSRVRGGHEDFAATKQRAALRNDDNQERLIKIRQNNNTTKHQNIIQKILPRHPVPKESHYIEEDQTDLNYIESSMRNVRINSRPAKHVTYQDTYEEHLDDVLYSDGHNAKSSNDKSATYDEGSPRQRPGSSQRQQHRRPKTPEYYDEEELQYMETCHRPTTTKNYNNAISRPNKSNKSNNNCNNNNDNSNSNSNGKSNKNNNNSQTTKRQISPKMSITTAAAAATVTAESELSEPTANARQHLRSNIFLDDSASTSTTPTSKLRRYARNSAVQRVSVGLPD